MDLSTRPLTGTPGDDLMFVGRDRELNLLHSSLSAGLNSLVLGGRGSGKTTLLNRLRGEIADEREGFRPVYVDGQSVDSFGDLLLVCLDRVGDDAAGRLPAETLIDAAVIVERLGRAISSGAVDGPRTVFLLDGAPDPKSVHTLFGKLRDQIWQVGALWVVAGDSSSRTTYLTPPADAFFSTVIELEPLGFEETMDMLRRRDVPLTKSQLRRIAMISGGIPRRAVRLASDVAVNHLDLSDVEAVQEALDQTVRQLGRPAAMLVSELAAIGPVSAGDSRLLHRLGWTRPRAVQVLKQLEEAGVVESALSEGSGARRRLYWLRTGEIAP